MQNTYLITGGAGFIGSNFLHYMMFAHPDARFVCLDKLTYAGNMDNLKDLLDDSRFRFVRADICDGESVQRLFAEEQPAYVINFAAETHVDRSIEAPDVFLRTNIQGTATLLDACRRYGVLRFHQISTDEVYGDLPLHRRDLFFHEESPLRPSSPYAASKLSADVMALAWYRTYGVPITISRCSNNYGPYQFPEKLIPKMILTAMYDQPLPVYGSGENVRDWLHVDDHCRAIDLIVHHGRVGEVYNVGGHNEMANIDVVRMILRALGKPETLIRFVPDRKGHDLRYAIDPGKIRGELGWHPQTDLRSGMSRTIDWYLTHPEWLDRIESGAYRRG